MAGHGMHAQPIETLMVGIEFDQMVKYLSSFQGLVIILWLNFTKKDECWFKSSTDWLWSLNKSLDAQIFTDSMTFTKSLGFNFTVAITISKSIFIRTKSCMYIHSPTYLASKLHLLSIFSSLSKLGPHAPAIIKLLMLITKLHPPSRLHLQLVDVRVPVYTSYVSQFPLPL